jgi:16S rRNA A1518/A1519 N6-dimethyltransferase RsmA/KsgA/DIM1 with predicted DNA glycosylase/AP lyase activity
MLTSRRSWHRVFRTVFTCSKAMPSSIRSPGCRPAARSDTGEFKIVANLPYAIATPWLDAVLEGRCLVGWS